MSSDTYFDDARSLVPTITREEWEEAVQHWRNTLGRTDGRRRLATLLAIQCAVESMENGHTDSTTYWVKSK